VALPFRLREVRSGGCMATARRRQTIRAVGYRLADLLELPREVFFDLSRVVITGNLQVSVENHHGLLTYDQDSLTLALDSGKLVVCGEGLVIGMVGASEMTVTGRIAAVRFEPEAPVPEPEPTRATRTTRRGRRR